MLIECLVFVLAIYVGTLYCIYIDIFCLGLLWFVDQLHDFNSTRLVEFLV